MDLGEISELDWEALLAPFAGMDGAERVAVGSEDGKTALTTATLKGVFGPLKVGDAVKVRYYMEASRKNGPVLWHTAVGSVTVIDLWNVTLTGFWSEGGAEEAIWFDVSGMAPDTKNVVSVVVLPGKGGVVEQAVAAARARE